MTVVYLPLKSICEGQQQHYPNKHYGSRYSFVLLTLLLGICSFVLLTIRSPPPLPFFENNWLNQQQQQEQEEQEEQEKSVVVSSPSTKSSCSEYKFTKRQTGDETTAAIKRWDDIVTNFVKVRKLTFLGNDALVMHRDYIQEIEQNGIDGMILECGVAKAGSSLAVAAIKNPSRCLHLFDTFEGIPEPSEKDGKDVQERYKIIQQQKEDCRIGSSKCNKNYYGNMDNLLQYDIDHFTEAGYDPVTNNIYFHKGLFDDTVWPAGPIAYLHLDGDWYESTYNMLSRVSPYMASGGYIILDDIYHWSGARDAFIDYFNIDYKWLQSIKTKKECIVEKDGTLYQVFLSVRGGVEVLGSNDGSSTTIQQQQNLVVCKKKP